MDPAMDGSDRRLQLSLELLDSRDLVAETANTTQHHGNHTIGYCASYFVLFMNKYVSIISL